MRMGKCIAVCMGIFLGSGDFAWSMPKQVIIVRHAEKNEKERQYYGALYQSLIPNGYERAAA